MISETRPHTTAISGRSDSGYPTGLEVKEKGLKWVTCVFEMENSNSFL